MITIRWSAFAIVLVSFLALIRLEVGGPSAAVALFGFAFFVLFMATFAGVEDGDEDHPGGTGRLDHLDGVGVAGTVTQPPAGGAPSP